jgi:hypothetical protein
MPPLRLSNGIMTDIYPKIGALAVIGIRSESTTNLNDGVIANQLPNLGPCLTDYPSLLLQIMDPSS